MKTFSRLSLFTLVCFGLALMFFGNTADVHAQDSTLEIGGETGTGVVYEEGKEVTATFVVTDNREPAAVDLMITGSKGLTGLPVTVTTDPDFGAAEVKATITADVYATPLINEYHEVRITAIWADKAKNRLSNISGRTSS